MNLKSLEFAKIKTYAIQRKFSVGGVVLVLLICAKWYSSYKKSKIEFEVAKTEFLSDYNEEIKCIGRPKPLSEVYLSVQHGGRLDQINKTSGAQVKAGEIIAVIDRTSNAAGLKSALSGYRLAQSEYNRTSSLFRSGSTTREQMDSARSNADIKRAELEQAKQRVEDSMVRSPIDGVLSVLVFKVGDKIPDGGRLAAVEDPTGTQITCRLPSELAAQLPTSQSTPWTLVDNVTPQSWTVASKVLVEQPDGGFAGLDREVKIESSDVSIKAAIGKSTAVVLHLPTKNDVTKLPSLAVIKKQNGVFALEQNDSGKFRWIPLTVLKQSAQETFVQGIAKDTKIMLLKDDVSKIDSYVASRLMK